MTSWDIDIVADMPTTKICCSLSKKGDPKALEFFFLDYFHYDVFF
jgi:hypothetical protein